MKLLDRVSRLVRSDAHGILDQLEERSLLLKQHLREAELEVADKQARVEALAEDQRRMREEAERLGARERSLDDDVELALAGGKTELARFAVARLLPVREARQLLESRIADVAAERQRLDERLEAQQAQLAELRVRVQAKLAALRRDGTPAVAAARSVAGEEIELELLRRSRAAAGGDAS